MTWSNIQNNLLKLKSKFLDFNNNNKVTMIMSINITVYKRLMFDKELLYNFNLLNMINYYLIVPI